MSAARKLGDRAPRYILNPHELKMVRVASRNRRRSQVYELEIIDMSESGMSFIVNWNFLPQIGEILKVEFPIPGEQGGKVAWFAEVMRLEGSDERPKQMMHFSGIKVGVRFIDLPKGHLKILQAGLGRRFHDLQIAVRWDDIQKFMNAAGFYLWEASKVALIVGGATLFFYMVTKKMGGNYDPNRPVNWGERFFERVIKK
ncbi:MAG: PilZ domain-containing protein [Bdellovibrionales bacterium]